MRIFVDCEFIEAGPNSPIHLISIALVAEDGRSYYAQNLDAPFWLASDWVRTRVLPQLDHYPIVHPLDDAARIAQTGWRRRDEMRREILDFIGTEKPEFWGWYADYDWVVLCQIFGQMSELPRGWPMYCRDLKQWADDVGNPQLPEPVGAAHHALTDATWNMIAWNYLKDAVAGQKTLTPNEKTGQIERVPVESSNLASVGYDPEKKILAVEFQNNQVYHYPGVPPELYNELIDAKSVGSFFNANIRHNFPFTKVS